MSSTSTTDRATFEAKRVAHSKREVVEHALSAHRGQLAVFVRGRTRPEDAEDVLQVAAARSLERVHLLDDPARVLPWLYTIHRNVLVDLARKQLTKNRLWAPDADPEEQPAETGQATCRCSVTQAGQLKPAYAEILSLVDLQDKDIAEVAQILDVTVNNATVRLHRARAQLKKKLQKHCGVTRAEDCWDCLCNYEGCCA